MIGASRGLLGLCGPGLAVSPGSGATRLPAPALGPGAGWRGTSSPEATPVSRSWTAAGAIHVGTGRAGPGPGPASTAAAAQGAGGLVPSGEGCRRPVVRWLRAAGRVSARGGGA